MITMMPLQPEGFNARNLTGLGETDAYREALNVFVGPGKYVKSTVKTYVYSSPGGPVVRTVEPTDTIGKVVHVNEKGNWGKLEDGAWINFKPEMFTVFLSVPPPTGVIDAVGREVVNLAEWTGLDKVLKVVGIVGVGVVGYLIWKEVKKNKTQPVAA